MDTDYKVAVSVIVQKTYDYHGVEDKPWGWSAASKSCSYAAGCAIGVSLSPEMAQELDRDNLSIGAVLHSHRVRSELLGSTEEPAQWVWHCLENVQGAHDGVAGSVGRGTAGDAEMRRHYRSKLEKIAKEYGLELKTA